MKKNKLKIFIVLVLSLTNIFAQKSRSNIVVLEIQKKIRELLKLFIETQTRNENE